MVVPVEDGGTVMARSMVNSDIALREEGIDVEMSHIVSIQLLAPITKEQLLTESAIAALKTDDIPIIEEDEPPPERHVAVVDISFAEEDDERSKLLLPPRKRGNDIWLSRKVMAAMTDEEWEAFTEQMTGIQRGVTPLQSSRWVPRETTVERMPSLKGERKDA